MICKKKLFERKMVPSLSGSQMIGVKPLKFHVFCLIYYNYYWSWLPRPGHAFACWQCHTLTWACIKSVYIKFLDNRLSLTELNYTPRFYRHWYPINYERGFWKDITAFELAIFDYQLRVMLPVRLEPTA